MNNILIIGYPKCGNTWIGYLLSFYFNAPYYDAYIEESVLSGQMSNKDISYSYNQNGFMGEHIRPDQKKEIRSIIKSHSRPNALLNTHPLFFTKQKYKKSDFLIMITRDPKDVTISYFYFKYFRMNRKNNHWSTFLPYGWRDWFYRYFCFSEFALKVAEEWTEFMIDWLRLDPLVIRYEDLLFDQVAEIKRITQKYNLGFSCKYSEQAKDFCDISNLKSREARINMPGTQNERFFRSGKAGVWEGYFSANLLKQFNKVVSKVAVRFGYTCNGHN